MHRVPLGLLWLVFSSAHACMICGQLILHQWVCGMCCFLRSRARAALARSRTEEHGRPEDDLQVSGEPLGPAAVACALSLERNRSLPGFWGWILSIFEIPAGVLKFENASREISRVRSGAHAYDSSSRRPWLTRTTSVAAANPSSEKWAGIYSASCAYSFIPPSAR